MQIGIEKNNISMIIFPEGKTNRKTKLSTQNSA